MKNNETIDAMTARDMTNSVLRKAEVITAVIEDTNEKIQVAANKGDNLIVVDCTQLSRAEIDYIETRFIIRGFSVTQYEESKIKLEIKW